MENKGSQNDWFGGVHTEHLTKNEESVNVVYKSVGGIITEEDLARNPALSEEGVVPGDHIQIESLSESAEQLVITPKPKKVRKTRVSKKK